MKSSERTMCSASPYNLDLAQYKFDSPLKGWEHHAPLPEYASTDSRIFQTEQYY